MAACVNIDFAGRGEIWVNMKTGGKRNHRREKTGNWAWVIAFVGVVCRGNLQADFDRRRQCESQSLSVFVWSAVFRDRVEMHVSGSASVPGLCGIDSVSE